MKAQFSIGRGDKSIHRDFLFQKWLALRRKKRFATSDTNPATWPLLKNLAIVCANCHAMIHYGGRVPRLARF
jgi:hypothetical protein